MPHLVVMKRPFVSLLVLVAVVVTFVVMRYALEQSATSTLGVPSRDNVHVSLASDGGSHVVVAWAATGADGTDIYAAVSDDGGKLYSAPVRVNDTAGEASASGEQPPRVAVRGATVEVLWVAKRAGAVALRSAASIDGGRSFSPARDLTPASLRGLRGWESAAIDDAGALHAVWLDGRDAAPMEHHHGSGGPAPRQDVFHAVWRGGDAGSETRVAENVCFCCKTSVAARGQDVYAAWRHLYDGGVRDIAVAHSADGGRTFGAPVRVSEDNWKLNACPDDGPALAIDGAGAVHVAWPTMVGEGASARLGIFHAVSRDGRTFGARERLDAGDAEPAHPRIAVEPSGRVAIVWDELTSGRRRVALRVIANGRPLPIVRLDDGRDARYPAIAPAAGGFAVSWTKRDGEHAVVRARTLS